MEYVLLTQHYTYNQITHINYGIGLIDKNDPEGVLIDAVTDLSTNKNEVLHLIKLCNRLSLDPIHLWDIVNDFLATK